MNGRFDEDWSEDTKSFSSEFINFFRELLDNVYPSNEVRILYSAEDVAKWDRTHIDMMMETIIYRQKFDYKLAMLKFGMTHIFTDRYNLPEDGRDYETIWLRIVMEYNHGIEVAKDGLIDVILI